MSKKCPKCGSILFDTVNFCPNCGFQLISKSQENQKTHRNSLESTKISDFLNNLNFLKTSHIYFHIKNENHFYLECSKCHYIYHLDCRHLRSFSKHIAKKHLFKITNYDLIINGICEKCQEEAE